MYHSSHMHTTACKSNGANSNTLATVGVSQHLRLKGQDSMNFQFQQHVQQGFDIPVSCLKFPEAFDSQNLLFQSSEYNSTEITAQGASTLQFRNSFSEMYSDLPSHDVSLYQHFTQEHNKLAEVTCTSTCGNSASSTAAPIRKKRIKWTKDLHEQFVAAVNSLGGPQKAKPKAVLLKMDSKLLTIFHVKSHLQKYRTTMFMQSTLERYEGQGRDIATELQQKIYLQLEIRRSIQEQLEIQRCLQMLAEQQKKQLYNVSSPKANKQAGGYPNVGRMAVSKNN